MDQSNFSFIRMHGITKRFGNVTANDSVDLEVAKGSIHAIVGENGAGKSTLMRILYGLYKPDSGSIAIDGEEKSFKSPQDAIANGIGMVSQHYAIIPELSCIDNLILGAEGSALIDRSTIIEKASKLASALGFEFDWYAIAGDMSPSAAQKLEIAKLLWRESNILILDEPTAMLSPEDSTALYTNLRTLADAGRTVIVVTHRIEEVMDYCERVTVMRNGKVVANEETAQTTSKGLAELIVGGELTFERERSAVPGRVSLLLREFSVQGDRGDRAVDINSLELRESEVVGVAGVDGNGQKELIESLIGIRPYLGIAKFYDRELSDLSVAERLEDGLAIVPEDRQLQGLIGSWSVADNAILGLHRQEPISNGWQLDRSACIAVTEDIVRRFSTKVSSFGAPISSLSGGNQQRFVVARALEGSPKLLIAFQPARGLDIRGTSEVYAEIRRRCSMGMCALIVSFDLDELLEHCDRIVVMFRGKASEPPHGLQTDRHAVGRMMVGLSP